MGHGWWIGRYRGYRLFCREGARSATAGFRTLGAEAIADVVERARSVIGFAALEGLEERYDELVPTDATLDELFQRYRATHPEHFAPVE